MALLHEGSPMTSDGISYHTSIKNISKFGGDHHPAKGKLSDAGVLRNEDCKRLGLKVNKSLCLYAAENTWNSKLNSFDANRFSSSIFPLDSLARFRTSQQQQQECAGMTSLSLVTKNTKSILSENTNPKQKIISVKSLFSSVQKTPVNQLADLRVDLERELVTEKYTILHGYVTAHETLEGDEEDESIFEIGASSHAQRGYSSKVFLTSGSHCSTIEPTPITASNSLLETDQSLWNLMATCKMDSAIVSSSQKSCPKALASAQSSTTRSAANVVLTPLITSTSPATTAADNMCQIVLNEWQQPPLYFTHPPYSSETPSSASPSVPVLAAGAKCTKSSFAENNKSVSITSPNAMNVINQGHVILRLQNGQMILCQTVSNNSFSKIGQSFDATGFQVSSHPTSATTAISERSVGTAPLNKNFEDAKMRFVTDCKNDSSQIKEDLLILRNARSPGKLSNDSKLDTPSLCFGGKMNTPGAASLADACELSSLSNVSTISFKDRNSISPVLAVQEDTSKTFSQLLLKQKRSETLDSVAANILGLNVLNDVPSAFSSSLSKRKCNGTLPHNSLSLTTSDLRCRSPSVPLLTGTTYNTRSKRNSIRSDGGTARSGLKMIKAADRHKEEANDGCNIYKKTYKTYSLGKSSYSATANAFNQLFLSPENQSERLQISAFVEPGQRSHGSSNSSFYSPFFLEFAQPLTSKTVKISSFISKELTYDMGKQPVKKRCSAAWDGIRTKSCKERGAISRENEIGESPFQILISAVDSNVDDVAYNYKLAGSCLADKHGEVNIDANITGATETQKHCRRKMHTKLQHQAFAGTHVSGALQTKEMCDLRKIKTEIDKNESKRQKVLLEKRRLANTTTEALQESYLGNSPDTSAMVTIAKKNSMDGEESLATSASTSASESNAFKFHLPCTTTGKFARCRRQKIAGVAYKTDYPHQFFWQGDGKNAVPVSSATVSNQFSSRSTILPSLSRVNNNGTAASSFAMQQNQARSAVNLPPSIKVEVGLKAHKRRKQPNVECFKENTVLADTERDQSSSYLYQHTADTHRKRKHRGKAFKANNGVKSVAASFDDSCNILLKEMDNSANLPPARGVWFDSKRNLWRASWRDNGSLRTKGFSIGDLGLYEARMQAVAYRIARVPDMEIPADLVGVLQANGTSQMSSSTEAVMDLHTPTTAATVTVSPATPTPITPTTATCSNASYCGAMQQEDAFYSEYPSIKQSSSLVSYAKEIGKCKKNIIKNAALVEAPTTKVCWEYKNQSYEKNRNAAGASQIGDKFDIERLDNATAQFNNLGCKGAEAMDSKLGCENPTMNMSKSMLYSATDLCSSKISSSPKFAIFMTNTGDEVEGWEGCKQSVLQGEKQDEYSAIFSKNQRNLLCAQIPSMYEETPLQTAAENINTSFQSQNFQQKLFTTANTHNSYKNKQVKQERAISPKQE